MLMVPHPTRFLRLADGRAARLAPRDAIRGPLSDHVPVIIAPLEGGPPAEVDVLLPERWMELRDGELRRLVAAAIAREAVKRRGR